MAGMLLTDSKIKGLKAKDQAYYVWQASATRGTGRLGLKIYPSGRKVFVYKYHQDGGRKFLFLGNYPSLSLADATVKCHEATTSLSEFLSIARHRATIKQLFDAYIKNQALSGKRSHEKTFNRLKQVLMSPHVNPDMLASEVTPSHVKLILAEFIQRDAVAGSNKIRSVLHAVFNFALYADHDPVNVNGKIIYGLDRNPVSVVPRQAGVDRALDRFLSWDEISLLMSTCQKSAPECFFHPDFAQLLLLCLFTGGQRPWELMTNVWQNVDLRNCTLTVPPFISKNGDYHIVPLCASALLILEEIANRHSNQGFIFPAKTKTGHLLPSEFAKQVKKFCDHTGFAKFTPRDVRRTFKTLAGEMGISSELRDQVQNHKKPGVSSKHYDRYDYLREKHQVITLWESKLLSMVEIYPKSS
ncbi:tyrosine-type recombinase/integrase [Candidatus Fukatsuia endosymbiont of Tuberolachnus salignus]|uniref:tyrosine-type recombinase/integrase n=1 Tax=Candidatus Fukatsuia endosymbiont of Tuberolachnus salignus TaxID=3077957 RepID=UPI00313CF447